MWNLMNWNSLAPPLNIAFIASQHDIISSWSVFSSSWGIGNISTLIRSRIKACSSSCNFLRVSAGKNVSLLPKHTWSWISNGSLSSAFGKSSALIPLLNLAVGVVGSLWRVLKIWNLQTNTFTTRRKHYITVPVIQFCQFSFTSILHQDHVNDPRNHFLN